MMVGRAPPYRYRYQGVSGEEDVDNRNAGYAPLPEPFDYCGVRALLVGKH